MENELNESNRDTSRGIDRDNGTGIEREKQRHITLYSNTRIMYSPVYMYMYVCAQICVMCVGL